ncbi:MAG: serine kinase [Nitrospirae bacterium]|nr:serine kinase [Nitrospirota bacterium]
MKLQELVDSLSLEVKTAPSNLTKEVTGGYVSDLLSDVIANSKKGNIWITLQTHQNIVAVATLKDLSGIILVNNRTPDAETLKKAEDEGLPILVSPLPAFELVGRLYTLGLRCQ